MADDIARRFMEAAKGYKSAEQKHAELLSDIESLKTNLSDIRKFVRTSKDKYSGKQLALLQLDQAVATLQLNIQELEQEDSL
jgi:chromosome segregation ATPase